MALSSLVVHVALLAALAPVAHAEPAELEYVLSSWTAENGLPSGDILVMTQDRDGYLWLGTSTGLVRFDGARFVVWGSGGEPGLPAGSVPALVASRDGSLWLSHGDGGVTRLQNGTPTTFGTRDGLPDGPVAMLLQDHEGTIWAGGRGGLARFDDGRWRMVSTGAEVFSLFEDHAGTLWVGTTQGVFARNGGGLEPRYPQVRNVQHIAEDATGQIWVTDLQNIVKPLGSEALPQHAADVRLPQSGWRAVGDRTGRIWIAALGGGLLRLAGDGSRRIERVSYESEIAGAPRSLFHDREGNVWVGLRPTGLLRLTGRFLRSDVPLEGLTNDGVRAMAASDDGSVWIGTGHNLLRFSESGRQVYDVAQARVLYSDAQHRVWAVTSNGLHRVENGRFAPVTVPGAVRWDRVTSMAIDTAGTVWLCSNDQGVIAWRGDVVTPLVSIPGVSSRSCSSAYADRSGKVWVGFSNGALAVHDGGTFRTFGVGDGLGSGSVLAIVESRSGVLWVATRNGVSRLRNDRFITLTSMNGPFEDIAAAFAEDQEGYLWIGVHTGAGVVRFDPREVEALAVDPGRQIEYRLFDAADGMHGELRQLIRAAGVRGGDGRLWFATGLGVVVFDPRVLPASQRPAAPRIERVLLDGRRFAASPDATLPNRLSALAIDYTTASIGSASKLRFRHRLEGRDDDWVAAGVSRSASYENLEPGRYRFQVSATVDGVWTEPTAWTFAVATPFYQRRSFIVLVILLALAAGVGAWWVRMGTLRRRYALVFEERARVSREVHDTLLQSLAAIGMELEAISAELQPIESPARESLRRLRKQVGHSLRDARDSIWGLRHNRMEGSGLVDAVGELARSTRHANVELSVSGRPVPCSSDVELQLLRISQEAVRNATRHGGATHIAIVIDYRADTVQLSVSDNGRGFVVDDHASAAAAGEHLGLLAMRERAERIRGELTITSSPGKGTIIEVVSPFDSGDQP